jgi:acyl-CoA synthetase (AMP-forming)/AMP-acid ligase II
VCLARTFFFMRGLPRRLPRLPCFPFLACRVCIPVPLFHCFGSVMGNLACLAHGATAVYPSGVASATGWEALGERPAGRQA